MSNSWWPHELQHTRLPCPSPSPGVCSDSCPLSEWWHPIISPSVTHFFFSQSFPASGSFSAESPLPVRWPKYLELQRYSSNEYSGLISFRIDWCDLLAVHGTCRSLLQHHSPLLPSSRGSLVHLHHSVSGIYQKVL